MVSDGQISFHPHPAYRNIYDLQYDIAIIVLNKDIDMNEQRFKSNDRKLIVNPICLPRKEEPPNEDIDYKHATMFGWGLQSGHTLPGKLQRADFEIHYDTTNRCFQRYCFISYWAPGTVTSCKVSTVS